MIGSGKVIPTKDEEQIGMAARAFLRNQPCRFVILIDDMEHPRQTWIAQVFARYRAALDTMLLHDEKQRAAVHFFATMLEAYYFAHSAAVNTALGASVFASDFAGDVETIRHPKNELKNKFAGFDARSQGALIVPMLGLAGETGQLLSEYKKHLRDGEAHRLFKERVSEELGDLLWYIANVASKFDLTLVARLSARMPGVG